MSFRTILVISALTVLATACQPATPAPVGQGEQTSAAADRPRKTLIVATSRDHTIMGHFNDAATDSEVSDILYAGLARKNALTLEDDPWLAESLPATERGTWTINQDGTMVTTYRLRPNVRWHDGVPLTSRDLGVRMAAGGRSPNGIQRAVGGADNESDRDA